MEQDSVDEVKFRHFLSKLFSVGRVGEGNMGAIVGKDSSLRNSWMPAIAGNVADDITFRVFDDTVSEYDETISSVFEAPIYDLIKLGVFWHMFSESSKNFILPYFSHRFVADVVNGNPAFIAFF